MGVKDMRINEVIRVPEVRLINQKGEQAGIVPVADALDMARDLGLDLVEVSPQAKPPVCKILDYGKYKYELEKKSRDQKKKSSQVKLKEVRMQPKIEQHDMAFKAKHVQEFLDQGNNVKVTIRFRGREFVHTELGKNKLDRILEILNDDSYKVDSPPRMEGRFMNMMLSPKSKK